MRRCARHVLRCCDDVSVLGCASLAPCARWEWTGPFSRSRENDQSHFGKYTTFRWSRSTRIFDLTLQTSSPLDDDDLATPLPDRRGLQETTGDGE